METDVSYNTKFSDLPDVLPIFPLEGVLLLPGGQLPLNIFEERYLAMIDQAMASDRLIGMVQPALGHDDNSLKSKRVQGLQSIGCVGKIIQFQHLPDGRYFILLKGLWRFEIQEELPQQSGFRRIIPQWQNFADDMTMPNCLDIDRTKLNTIMEDYLKKHEIDIDCSQLDGANDVQIITALSMICPLTALDKQALLEAENCKRRAEMFMMLMDMAVHHENSDILH